MNMNVIDIHFPDTILDSSGVKTLQSNLENVVLTRGRVELNTVSGRDGTTFNIYTTVPDKLRISVVKFLNEYGLNYSFTIYKG